MNKLKLYHLAVLAAVLAPYVFGAAEVVAQSVVATGSSTTSSGAIKVTVTTPPNDVVSGPTNLTSTGNVSVSSQGSGSVGIIITGSATGFTANFQGSVDGTNYVSAPCVVPSTGSIVTSASANGSWTCQAAGYQTFRANLSAISGGTFTATLNASAGSNQPPIGTQGTATNITAVAGNTILTGNGVTGTGSARVTIASDNTAFAVNATGQAGTNRIGYTSDDPCTQKTKLNAAFSTSSGGPVSIVALSGSTVVYVCSITAVTDTAIKLSFIDGTGGSCASAQHAIWGSTTAASGMSLSANGGFSAGSGNGSVGVTTAASALCLLQSGTSLIAGNVSYVQQ